MSNTRLKSNLQNSRKHQSYFQRYSQVLKKFAPASTSTGVNREVQSLLIHLAHLYKLLKVAFVPFELFYKPKILKKFAPAHTGSDPGSTCFDPCEAPPPTLPKADLICLGYFSTNYFYLITTGLLKHSKREKSNDRTNADNFSYPHALNTFAALHTEANRKMNSLLILSYLVHTCNSLKVAFLPIGCFFYNLRVLKKFTPINSRANHGSFPCYDPSTVPPSTSPRWGNPALGIFLSIFRLAKLDD